VVASRGESGLNARTMHRKSLYFHFFVQVGKVTGAAGELDLRR
jgi:hypothetical protein